MPINRKAQIPETITWIVATLIVITLLVLSILGVSLLNKRRVKIDAIARDSSDLIPAKSLTAYLLTKDDSGERVFEQINESGDLNEFNAPLSSKIFKGLYSDDYIRGIWLDVRGEGAKLSAGSVRQDYYQYPLPTDYTIDERIYFGEIPDNFKTKNLALFLRK